ncbi:MAG: Tetratricopeptide repeat protein [Candidatus Thermoplasmatota archaeon]|nr:Tetratricopeptide repeat protein [Candidatus Thermoplasmatota archaeon]
MACLKCGTMTEDGALLCESCADATIADPSFFLNPVLIGQSVFHRLREEGSAAVALGPAHGAGLPRMKSYDIERVVNDAIIPAMRQEEVTPFCERCNTILAHLGVPLKFDRPVMLLNDDSAKIIGNIVQKVNALDGMYPGQGVSDLYLRMGMVYWYAYHGILLRTAPETWCTRKRHEFYGRAKRYLSSVPETDDLRSIAEYNLGVLSSDAHDWTTAEEHLSKALAHFPGDLALIEYLAKAHLELGNEMEAMARIDEALASANAPRLWVLKGRLLEEMGMRKESMQCYNRALTLDPKYIEAYDRIISVLKSLGKTEEATLAERQRAMAKTPDMDQKVTDLISEFKKATAEAAVQHVKHTPPPAHRPPPEPTPVERVSYPIELAREAISSGNYDSAIQMSEEILGGDPGSREAQLILIESLVATSDMERASAAAHSFYEKNREDSRAWYWRGVVASKTGKWGAAVQYYSKAVTLDPSFTDSWLAMGELLLENDKVSGADESFSRVIQMSPNNPRAWLGKAKAMHKLGRWGAAIQCMDKYNMVEPNDKGAWLLKADLLFEKEKHRRAIEAYDKFLELSQDDSYALGRKGIALNALGMQDEARACLEEAVRLDANNREAANWLKTMSEGGGP